MCATNTTQSVAGRAMSVCDDSFEINVSHFCDPVEIHVGVVEVESQAFNVLDRVIRIIGLGFISFYPMLAFHTCH